MSEALAGFDTLAQRIAGHLGARGDGATTHVQLKKARQSAVILTGGSLAFLTLCTFLVLGTRDTLRDQRRFEQEAVPGEARIEERRLAPNGYTPRLIYSITTPEGRSGQRNVEVDRALWDQLAGATTVPVLYVPDDPENSHLLFGEVVQDSLFDQPLFGYGLPAVLAAICLLFLFVATLQWRGLDLDFDSKTPPLLPQALRLREVTPGAGTVPRYTQCARLCV